MSEIILDERYGESPRCPPPPVVAEDLRPFGLELRRYKWNGRIAAALLNDSALCSQRRGRCGYSRCEDARDALAAMAARWNRGGISYLPKHDPHG